MAQVWKDWDVISREAAVGDILAINRINYHHYVLVVDIKMSTDGDSIPEVTCVHIVPSPHPSAKGASIDHTLDARKLISSLGSAGGKTKSNAIYAQVKKQLLKDIVIDDDDDDDHDGDDGDDNNDKGRVRIDNKTREIRDKGIKVDTRMDAVSRALKDVGSMVPYDLWFNNCEHWVTHWKYGASWSSQVVSFTTLASSVADLFDTIIRSCPVLGAAGRFILGVIASESASWVASFIDFLAKIAKNPYFLGVSAAFTLANWYFYSLCDQIRKARGGKRPRTQDELKQLTAEMLPVAVIKNMIQMVVDKFEKVAANLLDVVQSIWDWIQQMFPASMIPPAAARYAITY